MSDLDRAYAAALRILNYRFNSEAELRRKLRAKDFDDEVVAMTLNRLREEKWLDDERFAGAFVRTRMSRGLGRLRIKRELAAAGVDGETASAALAGNVDAELEREKLVTLCRRKAATLKRRHGDDYFESEEGRAKLAASLSRGGYETSLVFEVIREVLRQR